MNNKAGDLMNRINVFVRRQRIQKLEKWTMRAILAEAFLLAIFPQAAAAAAVFGIVLWFLRLHIDTKFKLRSLPFDLPVSIFIVLGALSVFMSPARSFELIYNYCGIVGLYGLTYLLIGQNIRTPEQVKELVKGLGAAAVVVVLVGYFQYIFGVDISQTKWIDDAAFAGIHTRIYSTLENPNILAGYLDVMICIALGILAKFGTRKQKLILIAAIILLAACLAMTYSRGAFLAIAIIFVIYGFLYDWRILTLFALIIGLLVYNDENFLERMLSIFQESYDSSEGLRIGIWVSTVSMIADHPFVGIGWGAYKFLYPQYNYYLVDTSNTIYHAHNLFLQTAAEVGIAGALAYFWYFFGTMFAALNLSSNSHFSKFEKMFNEELFKTFMESKFLQNVAQAKSMLMLRTSDFINEILEKTSKPKKPKKTKKTSEPELVHHEEMKFHNSKKSKDDKKSDEDNIDIQKFAENVQLFQPDADKLVEYKNLAAGMKLGIGLAFLSMALNGMTDDLLFNIPSSILMWMLGALGAAINLFDEN